jgi:cytochrome c553
MRRGFKFPLIIEFAAGGVLLGLLIGTIAFVRTLRYGLSAHDRPTAMEAFIAGRMRHWSIPADLHRMKNPVPLTPEVIAESRAHFADHCAQCHGNDGKGKTDMGQHLYPRAPDLTSPETQSLSDGEIFATIENGVRLTGMPGFGNGTAESAAATWTLVHFIRHLPKVTPEEIAEMEKLNPKSPEEWEQMQEETAFLAGGDETPAPTHESQPRHH